MNRPGKVEQGQSMTEERTEETRQQILREASVLFMELGYRAVSTRMVAAACGLTQPALYHHFSGKQDLYVAVLMEELARLRDGLTAIVRLEGTSRERLARAASFLTERTDVDHALMAHDIRWELSPERRRHVGAAFTQALVQPMAAILGDAAADGVVRTPNQIDLPMALVVMHFLNVVRFVVTSAHESRDQGVEIPMSTLQDRGTLVLTLFLEGMGAERPARPAR
jgi:AcrR family transcriptional regulator